MMIPLSIDKLLSYKSVGIMKDPVDVVVVVVVVAGGRGPFVL
ncbi:MAG: hypothetical protein V3V45_07290 [Candidatus Brocadiales bacterium]